MEFAGENSLVFKSRIMRAINDSFEAACLIEVIWRVKVANLKKVKGGTCAVCTGNERSRVPANIM